MYSLVLLIFVSSLLAFILTPFVKLYAWRVGLVDQPDQKRKIHATPIPRVGGVAVLASMVGAYGILMMIRMSSGSIVWQDLPLVFRLVPALLVIFGVGLLDDVFSIRPSRKLIGQVVAAGLAWFGGVHISGIAGYSFSGAVSLGVTVLWIVACTNAINLIDGMDGLAVGVSLFAALTMLIAALINHTYPMALAVAPLAGALLGFLRYNFNPASIFLGDCGSLTIGFLLGCYGALWSEKSSTLLGLAGPALALAVPLVDVGLAVSRRLLRGQPIFSADRAHIHHKLLSRGLPTRQVVLILYGVCGIGAAASLMEYVNHGAYRGFVIVIVGLAGWLGLQFLGYKEFGVAGRIIAAGTFRTVLSAQLALDNFKEGFSTDLTLEQSWELLCRTCPKFGFSGAVLRVDGEIRKWGTTGGWQARIDLPERGHISLWRAEGSRSQGAVAVLFLDFVSNVLAEQLKDETAVYQ